MRAIVVVRHDGDRADKKLSPTEITLASLRNVERPPGDALTVVLIGESADDALAEVRPVSYVTSEEFLDDLVDGDYVEIVDAGTRFTAGALTRFYGDTEATASPLYVHREKRYAYLLNPSLHDVEDIGIDDDERLWIGSTPSLVSAALFHEHAALIVSGDELAFPTLFASAGTFGVLGPVRSASAREDRSSRSAEVYQADWYMDFICRWDEFLTQQASAGGLPPRYLQQMFYYLLQLKFRFNTGTHNKHVLQGRSLDEFFVAIGRTLRHVDDAVILIPAYKVMNRSTLLFLLRLKHEDAVTYEEVTNDKNLVLRHIGIGVWSARGTMAVVDSMDIYEGVLEIAGYLPTVTDIEDLGLELWVGDRRLALPDDGRYNDHPAFGRNLHRHPTFIAKVPVTWLDGATHLRFVLVSDSRNLQIALEPKYRKPMAKLSRRPHSYWSAGGFVFRAGRRAIRVASATRRRRLAAELRFLRTMVSSRKKLVRRAGGIRLLFWMTRWFIRRRGPIWIYYDKLYKAGDNGEYAYSYARQQRDGIRKYYVLNKDSDDARRFRDEGKPFVRAGSLKNLLLFLNASVVFATHTPQFNMNGFKLREGYFRDLFDYRTVFIQHGLTVQRLPWVLSKYVDNTRMYCVASPFERDNLLSPEYGYAADDVRAVGLARYDGLPARPPGEPANREILITPTWRNYLAPPPRLGESRARDERFLQSAYFTLYDQLLSDERLNAEAERLGYTITFLLHPVTSSHAADFDHHGPQVQVLAATGDVSYEQLLSRAALMVTDYSGVQFDLAYMNKPLVYFHPPELPASYDEGVYHYETDALGQICTTVEALVDSLCVHMANGCQIEPKYRERVDKFFFHHDNDNARRIYEASRQFQREVIDAES